MMCTTCRQKRNTIEIIPFLSCPTNFQMKVLTNGSNGPIYAHFEHINEELERNHKPLL
jgi:hypothetical protein